MDDNIRAISKKYFDKETKRLKDEIERAKELVELNKQLKRFNWALLHPYLNGGHIYGLKEAVKDKTGGNDAVFRIFASSFFQLRSTALFIDGYFKKRPCIEPYSPLIDQSVIMCLQKDYAGAINTLIPVIEGSIRHYLLNVVKVSAKSISNSKDLLRVFYHIKLYHRDRIEIYYRTNFGKEYAKGISLNENQVKQLVKYRVGYLDLWFSIIQDFFKHNLYLDTRGAKVSDKLNRHSIFHGFNGDIYYSFENYLKVYSCLHYLAWAFTFGYDNLSILADIPYSEIDYKWKAFEKIKLISELLVPIKSSVYDKYSDFNKAEFEKHLFRSSIDDLLAKFSSLKIEDKLKFLDKMLSEKNIDNNSQTQKFSEEIMEWVLKKMKQ